MGQRHVLAAVSFLGTVNLLLCRVNMSISVVSMTTIPETSHRHPNDTLCPTPDTDLIDSADFTTTLREEEDVAPEFNWSLGAQGDLLGIYFYGYTVSQLPGGWLAEKIGFKKVVLFSTLASSLLTLLTPVTAEFGGYLWLMVVRFLVGFFHGPFLPAMQAAWSKWAPPQERSTMTSCHTSGFGAGSVLMFLGGGVLAATLGWRSLFYVCGGLSLAWCLAWQQLVFDTPQAHPRMGNREGTYIVESLADEKSLICSPTPWRKILTCPAVWAIVAVFASSNWGLYQLLTMMPIYLKGVFGLGIAATGLISALPFLLYTLICLAGGCIADLLRMGNCLRTVTVRKVCTALGLLVPALTVVLAGYLGMGCNAGLAVAFFIISVGFTAFTVPGAKANMLDFAPAYTGVIYGIGNTMANVTGFLAPQATGHLLDVDNSLKQWLVAFWISGIVYIPGWILFQIFGTDELKEWSVEPEERQAEYHPGNEAPYRRNDGRNNQCTDNDVISR